MIAYFTGTGNSRYIAEHISAITGDTVMCINEKIKTKNTQSISVDGNLIFAVPTYAWRIPRIVKDWIIQTDFKNVQKVWFVMDCGSDIGNATKYNISLCKAKGFHYMGTAQVIMPENYIAMYDAPSDEQAVSIIKNAIPIIEEIANRIVNGRRFEIPRNNITYRIKSTLINPVFYKFIVKADVFFAESNCIGCGRCVNICPLSNVQIKDNRPVWGKECTHCMACICYCPEQAIEYGKKSQKRFRYCIDKIAKEL